MVTLETGDCEETPAPSTVACIDFLGRVGYRCLESADGLRPHLRRPRYGYDNLCFVRAHAN
jgi:hypothetical protein